jgi:2,3-bisphosphoglycerate-independent phosphoglycerate mutase
MRPREILQSLSQPSPSKIVLLVMDGLGGLPREPGGRTELETARRPNMNALARTASLGLIDMVGSGITPGSGAGHLALFGYDPIEHQIGRGVLSALGIGMDVSAQDVCIRGNFCTLAEDGTIADRRAGRIPTAEAARLCEILGSAIPHIEDAQVAVVPEKEYRFVLRFRGPGLDGRVADTDPQKEGRRPLKAAAEVPEAKKTARLADIFAALAGQALKGRKPANGVLLRGFDTYPKIATLRELYGLNAACVGTYPMYRGLAKLVGMEVLTTSEEEDFATLARVLREAWPTFDYFFIHVKKTDSYGEDGNFEKKVEVIERVDAALVPAIVELGPGVLAIAGDHSTPAVVKGHSWHPVPLLLSSPFCRGGESEYGETACARGALGRFPAVELMSHLLAHSGRLAKFGA